MIDKETYKRLTNNNLEEYNPELDFCADCKYYGEPCGCNRPNGTCDNYDRFLETYSRLAELEDKIMYGTLVELPCKVGDTGTALIDTLLYDNSIQKVKIKGIAYIVEDENGDITFQHTSRVFFNKNEAEAKLKELQENKK